MRRVYCLLLTLPVLAASVMAAAATDAWDAPDSKWRSGPAKYLLTKEEDQTYKKLKTDEERTKFVEEFWARRDPTAGTPDNEYRDEFYRRAREAAARFTEDNGKGWQDDRGRVFILFGKPDEVSSGTSLLDAGSETASSPDLAGAGGGYSNPGSESRPQAPTKTAKFIYLDNPLSDKKGDRLELNFRGEVTGGYRLDERIDWSHPLLRGLSHATPPGAASAARAQSPSATAPPESAAPQPSTTVPPAPVAPPPVEATPQSELMQQLRGAPDLSAPIPLDVTVNFYKAAKGTFATLTLEVKRSALPAAADPAALVMTAEILDTATGESVQRFFKPDSFGGYEGNTGAAAGDVLLFQAERPVNPGSYRAVFAIKDPATGDIGKLEKELVVPSFESQDLSLSTVTLARKMEPLASAPPPDQPAHFVLGAFKVVPRPDSLFKEGENLSFYYQIYGATPDPTTTVPKVDLSYAFEKNISGQWKMVGGKPLLTPGQSGLVQAFTLPMRGWPPGDYRISIKVTDTIAAPPRTVTAEVPFQIVGAAGAAKSKAKSKG